MRFFSRSGARHICRRQSEAEAKRCFLSICYGKAVITQQQNTSVVETETPIALIGTPETVDETEAIEPALEAQISALLAVKHDLSSREVAQIVGKPHTTVYRALAKVKQYEHSNSH